METRYLSCAETAALLRQALKESFPGVKFKVQSKTYAGGASINVKWKDGPTVGMVKAITGSFEGAYFDGMIDYKGSRYHKLDGQPVHFGANFIFEERSLSKDYAEGIAAYFKNKWGRDDWLAVSGCDTWGYRVHPTATAPWIGDELEAYDADVCGLVPQKSATLSRVEFAGDDGYGMGTVGPDPEHPDGSKGYPSY
jgi:hypothetical protein